LPWPQRVLTLTGYSPRPGASLAMPGAAAGCADQAHMSRELRALTGPAGRHCCLARSTRTLSDLFQTEAAPAG
jgi:hypothetical protein